MTDLEWLREQLARFAYKPGWEFQIDYYPVAVMVTQDADQHQPSTHVMRVKYFVLDSRYEDSRYLRQLPNGVRSNWTIDPVLYRERDPVFFAAWFQNLLFEIEMHESREWFRRDGQIYDDPHAERTVK